jgi:pimeloyl-ACP methyl ester carboxylesterase
MNLTPQPFDFNGLPVTWYKTGTGKPLLILHGWGASSRVMAPLAEQLKDIRTCMMIDFPGFGMSPEPPRAWAIDDYTDMVEAFIKQNCPDTIDLLVHSFGNRVALKLLNRESVKNNIGKVLVTGGAGMKPRRSLKFYFKKYLAKTLKAPFLILPGSFREKGLSSLRNTSLWKSLGSSDYKQLSGVMRETFVKSVSEHQDHTLDSITHDILLLWGRNDESTPVYQAERLEKGLKNSALVIIEDAAHYPFLDKPKQFAAIAKAFLEG